MTLQSIIEDMRESLIQEKRKLETLLREAPIGKLIYSKNTANGKTYYKWYVAFCGAQRPLMRLTSAAMRNITAA